MSRIELPATLDQDRCSVIKDSIQEALKNRCIQLDGKAVEKIGTTATQLFLSTLKTCREQKISFVIEHPSPALKKCLEDLSCLSFFDEERVWR